MELDPGAIGFSAFCRCVECETLTNIAIHGGLERVANSPDEPQPGDFVAMVVKFVQLADGWELGEDLKPRCPKHARMAALGITDEELAHDPADLATMRGTDR